MERAIHNAQKYIKALVLEGRESSRKEPRLAGASYCIISMGEAVGKERGHMQESSRGRLALITKLLLKSKH